MARDWWRVVLAATAAVTLGALCALGGHAHAAKASKRQDPAEAQRAIEAAAQLLQRGKVDQAVQSLSATLAGGNLPPAAMAKAFYVRGMAYREQKKPAQAISDLTSALWLKGGLGGEDRADALKQRAAAYADAGLTERGEVLTSAVAAHPPAKKAGSNWLGSIFGSPASPAPQPAERPTPAVAKAPPGVGAWASKTEVQADRRRPAVAAPAAVKPPKAPAEAEAPPARAAEGRFQVQVATVRTKAEALALAAKAKREHAAVLAASEPEIDHTVLGNMGSFYRVRFGPFADAQQTQAVCAKLHGSGLDCMPVAQ